MKAHIDSLGKLDCLCSRKKSFQLTSGRFLTCFRGGPILSLPLTVTSTLNCKSSSCQKCPIFRIFTSKREWSHFATWNLKFSHQKVFSKFLELLFILEQCEKDFLKMKRSVDISAKKLHFCQLSFTSLLTFWLISTRWTSCWRRVRACSRSAAGESDRRRRCWRRRRRRRRGFRFQEREQPSESGSQRRRVQS